MLDLSVYTAVLLQCSHNPVLMQDHQGCSQEFINGLEYSQVAGLIIGMIALGFSIDRIGRRMGTILTASVMVIGAFAANSLKRPRVQRTLDV